MARKSKKARNGTQPTENNIFELRNITPKTQTQKVVFNEYNKGKSLFLSGTPGTGKTFISLYLALKEVLQENSIYKKVIICRSAEPTKDIGFLPGTLKEKIKIYELPYKAIFGELFGNAEVFNYFLNTKKLEFMSTSFIRGITLDECILIIDETQNLAWNELYSMLSRCGTHCKVIFCGDYKQSDLHPKFKSDSRKDDILKFIEVIKLMSSFSLIEFTSADIVRGPLVKEFILSCEKLGL